MLTGLEIIKKAAIRANNGNEILPMFYYQDVDFGKRCELTYNVNNISYTMVATFLTKDFGDELVIIPKKDTIMFNSTDERYVLSPKYIFGDYCYIPLKKITKMFEKRDKEFMKSLDWRNLYAVTSRFIEAYFPINHVPKNNESEKTEKELKIGIHSFTASGNVLETSLKELKELEAQAGIIYSTLDFFKEDIDNLLNHYSELNKK